MLLVIKISKKVHNICCCSNVTSMHAGDNHLAWIETSFVFEL